MGDWLGFLNVSSGRPRARQSPVLSWYISSCSNRLRKASFDENLPAELGFGRYEQRRTLTLKHPRQVYLRLSLSGKTSTKYPKERAGNCLSRDLFYIEIRNLNLDGTNQQSHCDYERRWYRGPEVSLDGTSFCMFRIR